MEAKNSRQIDVAQVPLKEVYSGYYNYANENEFAGQVYRQRYDKTGQEMWYVGVCNSMHKNYYSLLELDVEPNTPDIGSENTLSVCTVAEHELGEMVKAGVLLDVAIVQLVSMYAEKVKGTYLEMELRETLQYHIRNSDN